MIVLEFFVIATMLVAFALSFRQSILTMKVAAGSASDSRGFAADRAGAGPDSAPQPAIGSGAGEEWPTVAIMIPAHNEERVIGGCLAAMTALDYPQGRLKIIVINDRSRDGTGAIVDSFAAADDRIHALHRAADARPGKSSAVADAMDMADCEVVVLFDADYLPRPGLLKELVVPFRDPTVGATMGRVVPYNSNGNTLTRLLDIERRAGYGVDQQGRAICGLIAQFGGTVGGIRLSALRAVGGWREGHLTEDTDLTFRLVLGGWRVTYLNHATCYEEVPEDWHSRFKQVRRWAYGHNDCMVSYLLPVAMSKRLTAFQKADALMILLFYFFPVMTLASTFALIPLLAYGPEDGLVCYACRYLGPALAVAVLAPYFQAAVAASQDRQAHVLRQMPLLFMSSIVSMLAALSGFALLMKNRMLGKVMQWDKTQRYRATA
jgi:cellulose synthase/poly-beta-1,6-N-acetylglucosamine synthase-like glycosyltransferase